MSNYEYRRVLVSPVAFTASGIVKAMVFCSIICATPSEGAPIIFGWKIASMDFVRDRSDGYRRAVAGFR